MALILPNSIENDTPADGAELQQNFSTIQTHINSNMIARDGSVAMTQPLLLVGDPTLPNHAANKGYVDTVDNLKVAKAGDVMTGALTVGSARIYNRTDIPTEALFTHKDASEGSIGFVSGVAGNQYVVNAAGMAFSVWNKIADAAGHNLRFRVDPTEVSSSVPLTVAGAVTTTAEGGGVGLSLRNGAATPYLDWTHGTTRIGYLQANANSDTSLRLTCENAAGVTYLRIRAIDKFYVNSDGANTQGRFVSYYSPTNAGWDTSNIHAHNGGVHGARISFYHPSIACQLRYGISGDLLDLVGPSGTSFTRFRCLQLFETSSVDTKRDVRPLRQHRKVAAVTQRKADSDTVDQPDIMALRPVIYRFKDEPTKMVLDKEGNPTDKTQPWSRKEMFGREARREQLGLIADEVQHVLPSAVMHEPDGSPSAINYNQITVALLDHVQTLTEKVAALEAKIAELS